MENTTLVANFAQHGDAEQALQALFDAGFSDEQARLAEADADVADDSIENVNARRPDFEESISERLADFLGSPDDDVHAKSAGRGSCVLTVDGVSEDECARAEVILRQFHPDELDQRETRRQEYT